MKFVINHNNSNYYCEWFDDVDFEKLESVSGVCGFIFNEEGKICIVNFPNKHNWTLPGGRVEECDKTFEECFIREVLEEVDLELKDIQRVGYFNFFKGGEEDKIDYSLRFIARIKKINKPTIDPAVGYIPERKFIDIKNFEKYVGWGENGEFQLKKAVEMFEKTNQ